MNIFICIDWFDPAYKAGGPVQSIVNLVKNFNAYVSYKIFCSNKDVDNQLLNDIEYDNWAKYNSKTQVCYVSRKYKYLSNLKREVKSKESILFVNGIYSFYFNLLPLLLCKASRTIISVRGMLHPGALSQKKIKKKIYISIWKLLQFHKRFIFHATDEKERDYIRQAFGNNARVIIASNFPRIFSKQKPLNKTPGFIKLISIGIISPMKNYLLILKSLQTCEQIVEYNIYGSIKDKVYWDECLQIIKILPKNVSVNFHNDVKPAKVEDALKNSHVFILPSKSENFGHAIYEALSAGKPVITSYNTPWNDLKKSNAGINVDPEHTEEITAVITFFGNMDNQEFNLWSSCANEYANNAIDINEIKEQYNKMFLGNVT